MTHIFLAAFHVMDNGYGLQLNDDHPGDPKYDTMWSEAKKLQAAGVRVMGMIGGAGGNSYGSTTLDAADNSTFEAAYAQLHGLVSQYSLQGLDLDVERPMSQAGITRLIARLKADFGTGFEVTLAPVATALDGGHNLSGFDYRELEASSGASIAFYNAQFYNGFGSMATTGDFTAAVGAGFTPGRVCAASLTNATDGDAGYVDDDTLAKTVAALVARYGSVCGISGWEYFNSVPGGSQDPWEWAQRMTSILRPAQAPKIRLTRGEAEELTRAWERSRIAPGDGEVVRRRGRPAPVDYFSLVTA